MSELPHSHAAIGRPAAITSATTSAPLQGLLIDLKATCRGLLKRRAFAFTAIVTLALGIGSTTAVFSVVDTVLLRALPYAQSDRLVAIWPNMFVANRELDAFRTRTRSFSEVAGFSPGWLMALTEVEVPRQLNAARVSGNMFSMLGAVPMLGKTFDENAEKIGNDKVTVLGYELWKSVFAGDPAIVGRSIVLGNEKYTVIGVMPRAFQLFDWKSDLWTPYTMAQTEQTWTGASGMLYGRLKNGVTPQGATADIAAISRTLETEFQHTAGWSKGANVETLRESVVGGLRNTLWLLFGGVIFLLLIATTNVANLLLVRASERRQELALRLSLGAPNWRIARLLFGESLLLAAVGGIAGVALAYAVVQFLPTILPADLPRRTELGVDVRILAFAALATLVPALLFGLAPVLYSWKSGLAAALREGKTGARVGERTRGVLVAAEVALAVVLMIGASLMGRSLLSLTNVNAGMRTDHLLTALVQPASIANAEGTRAFWRELIASIEAIPGVLSAGTILHLPMSGRNWMADIQIEGAQLAEGATPPRAAWQSISNHYFGAAGVPVLSGRAFDETDRSDAAPVVIVNSVFADKLFPGQSPIGKRIKASRATSNALATIVGVVGSVRHDSLNTAPAPEVYVPFEQKIVGATTLVVHTTGEPTAVSKAIRERIWAFDKNVTIDDMRAMSDVMSASLVRPRLLLIVLGAFAITGLLLGAVGIYGVVAYGVQQRQRELGIRSALGADARALKGLIVRGGVGFAFVGVAIGIPVALALSRVMSGFVYGVRATDPLTFVFVTVSVVLLAVLASWFPARRAARSDPMSVLRED